MEFPVGHIERHQQVTALQEELPVRYAKLQMQYEALHQEMIGYKTKKQTIGKRNSINLSREKNYSTQK